ncbi:hypothetical protein T02_4744 [Trichinella nativa]|uniref:Uncharacterized protein n=1 Tax=Trichinella nativa TaxID=6335 RepID=A0A0V1KKU6_9BILA|nr:hypothetical protein T02_4744 [Trichinella nativa]
MLSSVKIRRVQNCAQCRGAYVNQHLHLPKYSRNTSTASKRCFRLSRSPCFSTCVIRNHERKYQSSEAVNEILENMHVDDLVFSIHEEEGF